MSLTNASSDIFFILAMIYAGVTIRFQSLNQSTSAEFFNHLQFFGCRLRFLIFDRKRLIIIYPVLEELPYLCCDIGIVVRNAIKVPIIQWRIGIALTDSNFRYFILFLLFVKIIIAFLLKKILLSPIVIL